MSAKVLQETQSTSTATAGRCTKDTSATDSELRQRRAKEDLPTNNATDEDASWEGQNSDEVTVEADESLHMRLQQIVHAAEHQLETWEQSSLNALDETFASALLAFRRLRSEVIESGKHAGETICNVIDHYADFEASATAQEKLKHGIEHFESLLVSVEQSHFSHSVQHAVAQAKERLLTFEEMPKPWRNNPYIVRGYKFYGTPHECVHALWSWHNETCNIWTHLFGAFLLLGIGIFHLPNTEAWQNSTVLDKIPIILFMVAALKCLLCSATWHTFCNIAHLHVKQRMACVDYMGITVLITASVMTTEYAVLYDHPVARVAYMLITLLSGALGVMFTWSPRFDRDGNRMERVGFFVGLAGAGFMAGVHACFFRDPMSVLKMYTPVLRSLISYGIGVIFYALHIPERFAPGTIFDYLGASHNFWHLFVMAGIYYHYAATVEIFAIHATPLVLT